MADDEELLAKLRELAARGATPGERAAAEAALKRKEASVRPPTDPPKSVSKGEYRLVPCGYDEWAWRWVPSRRDK